MTGAGLGVIVFAAGAVYEFGCARWVAHVGAGRKFPAIVWSGVNCVVTLTGVEALLRGRLFAALYVLGFMVGTWLSMVSWQRLGEAFFRICPCGGDLDDDCHRGRACAPAASPPTEPGTPGGGTG